MAKKQLILFLTTFATAAAMCLTAKCNSEAFTVHARKVEGLSSFEPAMKNKIVTSSRFWGKRAILTQQQQHADSIRWGKTA
ncbi:hypothetical protein KIN20_036962 [Parelaphostrongylus tenuis]|uniref:Uncharacterized protein n=1 Tax=Parelaphostrongylus tenuis TaxID=148309 RepID=A0AAD5WLP4_PARTN|nr:hypothetical protein KIN20_036962 [Parelaphostrongylus tenuis]